MHLPIKSVEYLYCLWDLCTFTAGKEFTFGNSLIRVFGVTTNADLDKYK